jgi:uncharacterized protein
MSDTAPVYWSADDDPEMQAAFDTARKTFRYFWRELAWEQRRIVPALDGACVKAPFDDGEDVAEDDDGPRVEQMWISDVEFDGRKVQGTLVNEPLSLTSVSQGDTVDIPLDRVADWMYVIDGEVYGAHTVNLLRSRMTGQERREHDEAWGLKFGDPKNIRLIPVPKAPQGILKKLFGKQETSAPPASLDDEHPMSLSMAESLRDKIRRDPTLVHGANDEGWTLLHEQSLAGSAPIVKVLLDAGADVHARTGHGMTALQLAESLRWNHVIDLLHAAGAR